jgi:aspartyl-tRNA(Asn)/glutamyl-tRNA(Gln) amidotransferase subunit B
MEFDQAYVDRLRSELPELPLSRMKRYMEEFGLSRYDADRLTEARSWSDFFDACIREGGDPKTICNWMNGDFARLLNETGEGVGDEEREETKITPAHLVQLTQLVADNTITGKIAKEVFEESYRTGSLPTAVVEARGLTQIADTGAIAEVVSQVLAENPGPVGQYLSGKEGTFGFFVGQIMRKTQGRANPGLVQSELKKQLEGMK